MADNTPAAPLVMRPAGPGDVDAIASMIRARSTWMRERGQLDWEHAADELAAQAAHPHIPVWVLTAAGHVIGCTTLLEESPAWLWTGQEHADRALFMSTTVTSPHYAGQHLGCHLAWWVLDHAARTGKTWVRRGTIVPELVRYYQNAQGWTTVREQARDGFIVTGLARRAQHMPDLLITASTGTEQRPPMGQIRATG